MKIQLKKALVDLTKSPRQSFLLLFALILGLWGFGSVIISYSVLVEDLKTNFNQTVPAHAALKFGDMSQAEAADLRSRLVADSRLSAVEERDFAVLRVEERPGEWIPLWFFGVKDFESSSVAKFFVESGTKSPPPGSVLFERNGKLITAYDVGKSLKVRSGPRTLQVPISGIVFDPGQAPATQEHFLYAYADQATWASLSGLESGKRVLVRFKNVASADEVKAAIHALALPTQVEVEVPKFEEHPHEWQLKILMLMIASIGFLALVLSAIIISQVMSALLKKQVRHIGIMKSVGATWWNIIRQYSLFILIIALVSLAIALPLAEVTGRAFSQFVATTINFNLLTTSTPLWAVLVIVASGFILPLVFAWLSLNKSASMSIRQTLSDPAVTVPGPISQKLPRPVRNLLRTKAKTFVVMVSVALGVMVFDLGFNIRESLREFINETGRTMNYDIQIATGKLIDAKDFGPLVEGVKGIKDIEYWIGGKGELESKIAGQISGLGIVALPFDTKHFKPDIAMGRWFGGGKNEPIEIVVNQNGWEILKKPALDTVFEFNLGEFSKKFKLVGLISEADRPKLYLDRDIWAEFKQLGSLVNTLSIRLEDRSYANMIKTKSQLEGLIETSSLPVFYVLSQAERVKIIADHLDIVLVVLILLSFLILAIGSIGTASAQTIRIMERTREIGVMRSIGAGPRQIVRQFLNEGMIVSTLGLGIGIIAAQLLSSVVAEFFGTLMMGEGTKLGFAFSTIGFVITIVVSLVFALISSLGPARNALKISTRKALSYE